MTRDPLTFLTGLARQHGPISTFSIASIRVVLLDDSDFIRDLLVTSNAKFVKGRVLERSRIFLGDGLLTSEGDAHRRQRRLVQPSFHRRRLDQYATTMADCSEAASSDLQDGESIDLHEEMSRLTLAIVGRTLFSADVKADASTVGEALNTLFANFQRLILPFAPFFASLPTREARRLREAEAVIESLIHRIVQQRRRSGHDTGDLLSSLIFTEDADHPGQFLTDREIRDQALTLFLAGHETTANALTWTWHLLATHPEIEARFHAEIDSVLQPGERPGFDHFGRLPFTNRILRESLRLFPPAWAIGRRATTSHQFGPHTIPANTIVLASQWVSHRNPDHFPNPDTFDPDRWTDEMADRLPNFAYFPFGGGARGCIGEHFARAELTICLVTLARRWRFRPTSTAAPRPLPRITLRPADGMPMRAELRHST